MAATEDALEHAIKCQDVTNSLPSIKKTIKLSCAASSPQYLVLGAHTGSLYFFDRYLFKFLQLVVFEDLQEPIAHIAFSPDEKWLAFATAPPHRNIYFTSVPIKGRRKKDLACVVEHKAEIRCLHWGFQRVASPTKDGASNAPQWSLLLFSADDAGVVLRTQVSASSSPLAPSALPGISGTSITTTVLYQADSRVNQLSFDSEVNQLIVSSASCTALLDFSRGQAFKVGTKPRNGPFGSSFYPHVSTGTGTGSSHTLTTNILAARPGNRIWVALPQNPSKVTQTLNFQSSLQSTTPFPLFSTGPSTSQDLSQLSKDDFNFHRLIPIDHVALLTWNQSAVFFVDIQSLKIIAWYCVAQKNTGYIADVSTTFHHAYVLFHRYATPQNDANNVASAEFTPQLAHLYLDWAGFLAWTLQAQDWARSSYILQKYAIDNVKLLQSIPPFMSTHAVDGNTANEIGKLVNLQLERIQSATKSTPSPQPTTTTSTTTSSSSSLSSSSTDTSPPHSTTVPTSSHLKKDGEDQSRVGVSQDSDHVSKGNEPTPGEDMLLSPTTGFDEDTQTALSPPTESIMDAVSSGTLLYPESRKTQKTSGGGDPFDFGSETAPAATVPTLTTNDINTNNMNANNPISSNVTTTTEITAPTATAPTIITSASPNKPTTPIPIAGHNVDDAVVSLTPNADMSLLAAEDLSSSAPTATTNSSSSVSSVPTARRKRKPRAVDIASPPAKSPVPLPPSSIALSRPATTNTAAAAAAAAATTTATGNTTSDTSLSMTRSPSGSSQLSDSTSSLPVFVDPSSGTSNASSPSATPSTTPVTSQQMFSTTSTTAMTNANNMAYEGATQGHVPTQWGSPITAPSILPHQPPQHTSSAPLSSQTPYGHASLPYTGSTGATTKSPPPLSNSTSSIPNATAKQPPSSSGPITTAELKQLGRDFKNKAKEGFKTFLSALPSSSSTNTSSSATQPATTATIATTNTGTTAATPSANVPTNNTSSASSTIPTTAAPITNIQSDPLTRKTIEQLERYLFTTQDRNRYSMASVYPTLKFWIAHYHNTLESLPNAAQSPLIAEILTACFKYEVSSPKHEQPLEWEETHAKEFVMTYLPSLILEEIMQIANERKWTTIIEYILENQQVGYDSWKSADSAPPSPSDADIPTLNTSTSSFPFTTAVRKTEHDRFNSRLEIEQHMEAGQFLPALKKLSQTKGLILILTYLPKIFAAQPKESVQMCANLYPLVRPHNIEALWSTISDRTSLELLYYQDLLNNRLESRLDEQITLKWLDLTLSHLLTPIRGSLFLELPVEHACFLSRAKETRLDASEKRMVEVPTPASASIFGSDDFNIVWTSLRDEDHFKIDRTAALNVCLKHGYWKGAISLFTELGDFDHALEMALAIDDAITFERLLSLYGTIPAATWPRVLLKSAHIHHAHTHFYSAPTDSPKPELIISADVLARRMSSCVDPGDTIALLSGRYQGLHFTDADLVALEAFVSRLSSSTFQQLLADGMKGERRKDVVVKSLKAYDQSVWAKRTPFFGPQIANVEFIEKVAAGSPENPLAGIPFFHKMETSKGVEWAPSFVYTASNNASTALSSTSNKPLELMGTKTPSNTFPTFLGEFGGHWGVHTRLSATTTCGRCGLPLLDPRAGKVAIFERCSHAFHETCVEEDACPDCLHNSFDTLLPALALTQ